VEHHRRGHRQPWRHHHVRPRRDLRLRPAAVFDAQTRDAARFLTQATFGIRGTDEIGTLKRTGYAPWLESSSPWAPPRT